MQKTSDGKETWCSRFMLAAASEYFERMFTSGMSEQLTGKVDLPFVTSKSLSLLLHYMYSGNLPSMMMMTMEDAEAAHLFQLPCIVNVWAYHQEVTVDNFLELADFNNMYKHAAIAERLLRIMNCSIIIQVVVPEGACLPVALVKSYFAQTLVGHRRLMEFLSRF